EHASQGNEYRLAGRHCTRPVSNTSKGTGEKPHLPLLVSITESTIGIERWVGRDGLHNQPVGPFAGQLMVRLTKELLARLNNPTVVSASVGQRRCYHEPNPCYDTLPNFRVAFHNILLMSCVLLSVYGDDVVLRSVQCFIPPPLIIDA